MISKVSIRNFKCLRDVQIDLERFTVFVGPNASGKSSILQGLNLLCLSFRGQEGTLEEELLAAISRGSNDCPSELAAKGLVVRAIVFALDHCPLRATLIFRATSDQY